MARKAPECTLRIEMVWDDDRKVWRVYTIARAGSGVRSSQSVIDTGEPLDEVNVARIRAAIEAEMMSWIQW
jgi:hypothetical protein